MYVYSGKCRLCEVGEATGFKDMYEKPLHTGDIVLTYTVDSLGFSMLGSLTVVVSDQFQTYSNGEHVEKKDDREFFVMGIRSVDIESDDQWRVLKLKDFKDVVNGERWPEFGFSFMEDDHG